MSCRAFRLALLTGVASAMIGCTGTPKPSPVALQALSSQVPVRQLWATRVGAGSASLRPAVAEALVVVAARSGDVTALDATTGERRWQADAGTPLSAGVGFDGRFAAVVTERNELVVFDQGKLAWRAPLGSRVVTAPLVAGERVFIHGIDRSVAAFDALNGRRLWANQRPGDPLTLAQPGVLLPVQDLLVASIGTRLVALDATRGVARQEWSIATPRGLNEVERLADVVGPLARLDDALCARAYQHAVGCVSTRTGKLLWTKPAGGYNGLASTGRVVVGADASDRVTAWDPADGKVAWTNESLLYHELGSPAALAKALVFGAKDGVLHFLSPQDGRPIARFGTDGSAITAAPVRAGQALIAVTQKGGVFAFQAD